MLAALIKRMIEESGPITVAQFMQLAQVTAPRRDPGQRLVLWPESGMPDYLRDGYPRRFYLSTTAGADPTSTTTVAATATATTTGTTTTTLTTAALSASAVAHPSPPPPSSHRPAPPPPPPPTTKTTKPTPTPTVKPPDRGF